MTQGKVVILGGTPRSGKTTLANMLAKSGFSKISFDYLSEALQKGFFEIVINDWTSQQECAAKKYKFFESIVETAVADAKVYGLNTVIDMYDFTPEYIQKLPCLADINVYFLAYPGFSVEQIRHNIRYYAQPSDWIAQVDDEYLTVVAQRCHDVNKNLVHQCEKYNCKLINTQAGDGRLLALTKLYDEILAL